VSPRGQDAKRKLKNNARLDHGQRSSSVIVDRG